MIQILGIAGFKGSGKNMCADQVSNYANSQQMAFADPFKEAILKMYGAMGITGEMLWGPSELRESPLPFDVDGMDTVRDLVIALGEWGREEVRQDIWTQVTMRRAQAALALPTVDLVILSDVRFLDEVEAIKEAGGRVWWIERAESRPDPLTDDVHHTEAEMLDPLFRSRIDYVVENVHGEKGFRNNIQKTYDKMVGCRHDLPADVATPKGNRVAKTPGSHKKRR